MRTADLRGMLWEREAAEDRQRIRAALLRHTTITSAPGHQNTIRHITIIFSKSCTLKIELRLLYTQPKKSQPEDVYLWALRLLGEVVFFFLKWQHSFQMKHHRVSVSAPEGFGRVWHDNSPAWVYSSLFMTVLNPFCADFEPCSVCALYVACLDWPIITENK